MERNSVTVRVPATTANLGPGFDVLGLALDIWLELTVTRSEKFSITLEGEGVGMMPMDETNYVVLGVQQSFKVAQKPCPTCSYKIVTRIPFGAGLGSSSAGIVAGLLAGLVLSGKQLPVKNHEALLQMATAVEGHPDNVAPAIYGGCQMGLHSQGRWRTERVPLPPGLQCLLLVTNTINNTQEARKVVPKMVPIKDVVHNMSRVGQIILAFSTNQLDLLKFCIDDRLHQVQRSANLPHLLPAIEAAMQAGAHAAWLSGSGPTVCALTSGRSGDPLTQSAAERHDERVAEGMLNAARRLGIDGVRVFVTAPVEHGAHIVTCDPPMSTGFLQHFSPLNTSKL
eukprot:PhF_6_TR36050/c0_g1_i1/m.52298/K00872/thrB1; homoserine kinase